MKAHIAAPLARAKVPQHRDGPRPPCCNDRSAPFTSFCRTLLSGKKAAVLTRALCIFLLGHGWISATSFKLWFEEDGHRFKYQL
jgi:hypothetical protein